MIFSCREIKTPKIPLTFPAKHTGRVRMRSRLSKKSDLLRILFRLTQVNRDIQFLVRTLYLIADILFDTITADIVIILTELIKIFGSLLRRRCIFVPKTLSNIGRSVRKNPHNPCIKKILCNCTVVFHDALYQGIVQNLF